MNHTRQEKEIGLNFPMESFLQVKQAMRSERTALETDKAAWIAIRKSRQQAELTLLDEQFKAAFEKLSTLPVDFHSIFEVLKELVQRGASARLLGNHELGSYNLAMLIQGIPLINEKGSLELISKIARLTMVAGADIQAQKAYAGNGGANSLEWICWYLAGGIDHPGLSRMHQLDQYACCYTLFPWVIEKETSLLAGLYRPSPFTEFLVCLRDSPSIVDWQEKILLSMIGLGFSPFSKEEVYPATSLFIQVAAIRVNWLGFLFPFEDERLADYVRVLKSSVTAPRVQQLMNAFTSSHRARKYFRAFFSLGPHWLLHYILESAPDVVFRLVERNEKELLIPFLVNFQSTMVHLRDERGNTLLHQAILCRGRAEKTVQLLLKARLSPQRMNNDGITPLALAVKHHRTTLIKLLK